MIKVIFENAVKISVELQKFYVDLALFKMKKGRTQKAEKKSYYYIVGVMSIGDQKKGHCVNEDYETVDSSVVVLSVKMKKKENSCASSVT